MLNIVLLFEADALRQNWIIAGSSLAAACAGRGRVGPYNKMSLARLRGRHNLRIEEMRY
jgi:hypothetical protein